MEALQVVKRAFSTIGESDPRPKTYLARLFHKPRYNEIVNIIKTHIGFKINVLIDVGCGRGILNEFLLKAGVRVDRYICCDINELYLQEAKGFNIDKVLCDAHDIPIRERAADLAICSEVLEHLENPTKALIKIFLSSSQYVLITFPDEKIKNALGFRYPEHISDIALRDVLYIAGRLGYELKLHKKMYFVFPPHLFDKITSFSYGKLWLFSIVLKVLSRILRELCLIKTEFLLFERVVR